MGPCNIPNVARLALLLSNGQYKLVILDFQNSVRCLYVQVFVHVSTKDGFIVYICVCVCVCVHMYKHACKHT